MTDPIGKCLRTVSIGPPYKIDLNYERSKTYEAFLQSRDLSKQFRISRAEPAYLHWIETPSKGIYASPLPVLADRKSGIICEVDAAGVRRYGFLDDVEQCIFFHEDWKHDGRKKRLTKR